MLCAHAVGQEPGQGEAATAAVMAEGERVYQEACADCHERPQETRAPAFSSLRQMGVRAVSHSLTHGKMRANAAQLSAAEIDAVVSYLGRAGEIDNRWIEAMRCDSPERAIDPDAKAWISNVGLGLHNHRYQSVEEAGLSSDDLSRLELRWALALPQTATLRAQPVLLGNTFYLSVPDSGQLYALDVTPGQQPCVHWVYDHGLPLRTSLALTEDAQGQAVLVFGDGAAHVQMLDARSGELRWRQNVKISSVSNTTGMPLPHGERIYVPISSGELNMGAAPDYECCTSHGGVVALNASSGEIEWIYRTMPEATRQGENRLGVPRWGPSGAPIWTSPTLDEKRGLLYVGTGQNTSLPATDTSDAILAIALDTGELVWHFQATANDIFLTGCLFEPDGPNCPPDDSVNADWDFGAPVILAQREDGRDILLAGQKSGVLWALDPDNAGEVLWQARVGPGGPAGGIHWGMSASGGRVFAAINQVGIPGEEEGEPGLHAFDIDSGERLWSYFNTADCSEGRAQRLPSCDSNIGLSAATLVIGDRVLQGSNDGFVKILDAEHGNLISQIDTTRPVTTVNGLPGQGGAIDNATVIAGNGQLFVQSGYGLLGAPGNLLLVYGSAREGMREGGDAGE